MREKERDRKKGMKRERERDKKVGSERETDKLTER